MLFTNRPERFVGGIDRTEPESVRNKVMLEGAKEQACPSQNERQEHSSHVMEQSNVERYQEARVPLQSVG